VSEKQRFETKEIYPNSSVKTESKFDGFALTISPYDAAQVSNATKVLIDIPSGTYGEEGWINIWAYNSHVGIRLVDKNILFPDDIIISTCGASDGWTGYGVKSVSLSNRQFEFCDGDGGYIAAYVGTTQVLRGRVYASGYTVVAEPGLDFEEIFRDFC